MSERSASGNTILSNDWFDSGSTVYYDANQKRIVNEKNEYSIGVFERVVPFGTVADGARWVTFAPGFPEGSFGYAKVDALLDLDVMPRLYIEYVGQGGSEKPLEYAYSTFERADLIEAQWRAHNVRSTILIAYDFSSLVMLELLQRQKERQARGVYGTRIEHVLTINGGLFADGHSRARRKYGKFSSSLAQHSNMVMRGMLKAQYSAEYRAARRSRYELRETARVVRKNKGAAVLNKAAGFIAEHKANAQRWDLFRVFVDYCHGQGITFHILGSSNDPFESRQVFLARERLGAYYPQVKFESIPGGHQSMWEQAAKIAEFVAIVARKGGESRVQRSWTTVQANTFGSRPPWATTSEPAVTVSKNTTSSRPPWALPSWSSNSRQSATKPRVAPSRDAASLTQQGPSAQVLPPSGYIISYS